MPTLVEQAAGAALRWDIPNHLNAAETFVASATLSPTVANPANFIVGSTTVAGFIYSIKLSATAAINYTFGRTANNPGYPAVTIRNLNLPSATPSSAFAGAGVAGPPGGGITTWGDGVLPANDVREVLAPSWIRFQNDVLFITTGLVACTISCVISWIEFTQ